MYLNKYPEPDLPEPPPESCEATPHTEFHKGNTRWITAITALFLFMVSMTCGLDYRGSGFFTRFQLAESPALSTSQTLELNE